MKTIKVFGLVVFGLAMLNLYFNPPSSKPTTPTTPSSASTTVNSNPSRDIAISVVCDKLAKLGSDIDRGIVGAAEFRPRMLVIYNRGRFTPTIEPLLRSMLKGVTDGDTKQFKQGLDVLVPICNENGSR